MTAGDDHARGLLVSGRFPELEDALCERVLELRRGRPLAPLTVVVGSAHVRTRVGDLLVRRLGPSPTSLCVTLGRLAADICRRGPRGAAAKRSPASPASACVRRLDRGARTGLLRAGAKQAALPAGGGRDLRRPARSACRAAVGVGASGPRRRGGRRALTPGDDQGRRPARACTPPTATSSSAPRVSRTERSCTSTRRASSAAPSLLLGGGFRDIRPESSSTASTTSTRRRRRSSPSCCAPAPTCSCPSRAAGPGDGATALGVGARRRARRAAPAGSCRPATTSSGSPQCGAHTGPAVRPAVEFRGDGTLTVVSVPDERAETREAVARRAGGRAPPAPPSWDCAVVVPHGDDVERAAVALEAAGIPVACRRPDRSTGPRLLLRLADCLAPPAGGPFARRAVVDLLSAAPLRGAEASPRDDRPVARRGSAGGGGQRPRPVARAHRAPASRARASPRGP